ncbi:hypothetical protein NPIL_138031 [Nephila pilipes]|uniref:Uncharacterized protein n=1 Tax=Nephila pilipes TaxID=299642 RepID=A0A8X6JTD5_NEPPI|nr:hypothetical protein NPIL_138031 [Nephila pilipes]
MLSSNVLHYIIEEYGPFAVRNLTNSDIATVLFFSLFEFEFCSRYLPYGRADALHPIEVQSLSWPAIVEAWREAPEWSRLVIIRIINSSQCGF